MDNINYTDLQQIGSFGLVAYLIFWATRSAWPKVQDHLDKVNTTMADISHALQDLQISVVDIHHRLDAVGAPKIYTGKQVHANGGTPATPEVPR